jgi:cobalt/nickel transport system permease protein
MNHAFLDRYSDLNSPVHRLNPSGKIFFALVVLVGVILLPFELLLWFFPCYISFCLAVVYLSGVPLKFVLKRILFLLPFFFFIILLNTIFRKGGIEIAALFLLRAVVSLVTLILLVATTRFYVILETLGKWHFPGVILIILSFMYQFFFILIDEMEKMVRVIRMRTVSRRKWSIVRLYAHLLGSLFIKSYDRSERVYRAMLMRGFDSGGTV